MKDSTIVTTDLKSLIEDSLKYIPKNLIISDLTWKYLVRCIYKGKNILITGPSGCGKTETVISAAKALKRNFTKFNCGAMQDPRTSLIGISQFDKERGTYFCESEFISCIKQKNHVILLDELNRCHPDGWNILLTATDEIQRYIRIDESPNSDKNVKVEEGVCFIATANIGSEYTATRVMDGALVGRFTSIVEMDFLSEKDEIKLLKKRYDKLDNDTIKNICKIADFTRKEIKKEDTILSRGIPTRSTLEMADLILDGFSFKEAYSLIFLPLFPSIGADSERSYLLKYIQKIIPSEVPPPIKGSEKKNDDDEVPW